MKSWYHNQLFVFFTGHSMKISIISVFPELHEPFLSYGIIAKAIEKKLIEFNMVKFSSLCAPKERIDEPICGPGVGMLIKPELIEQAINQCEKLWGPGTKIFFSPQGTLIKQHTLKHLADNLYAAAKAPTSETIPNTQTPHLIFVCTRYEGTDARVEEFYADYVFSIGDYVLMGGDLPAQVVLEGLLRHIPGIVGKQESVDDDSFSGSFLDHPHFGLPAVWKEKEIPEIVRSGNHGAIAQWRKEQAAKKTIFKRFDWFVRQHPSNADIKLAQKSIPNHYVALMHSQVLVKGANNNITPGDTSLASIDIHDIARSSRTYGIKNFFIVSLLKDQHQILSQFLDFWRSDEGNEYNQTRSSAVSLVQPTYSLNEVIDSIETIEGKRPLIVSTSAQKHTNTSTIDYFSQGVLWEQERPILFVFGTGQGLTDEILNQSDYLLLPVSGLTTYNHLSVRSAVAIILDRWLGLHPEISQLEPQSTKNELAKD